MIARLFDEKGEKTCGVVGWVSVDDGMSSSMGEPGNRMTKTRIEYPQPILIYTLGIENPPRV